MKLWLKIFLGIVAVMFFLSAVNILFSYRVAENSRLRDMKTTEVLFAKSLAFRFFRDIAENRNIKLTDALFDEKRLREEKIEYILVFDKKGYLLAYTYLSEMPKQLLRLNNVFGAEDKFRIERIENNEVNVYDVAVPVMEGIVQVGTIHLGVKLSYLRKAAKATSDTLIIISLISSLLGILVALVIASFIVRPINKLTKATLEISRGNLSARIKVNSKDEVGSLGIAFNQMAQDISEYQQELIAAKDYADSIVSSMLDALVVIDPEGKIATINQATSGLLGYKEDELIGKPAAIIFAEEDEEVILNRADVPAMLISKDFKILKVNDTFIRLMGVSREDIIGGFCYKVTHNRESACALPYDICPAKEAIEKNKPCVQLHTHFDKQGNPFLVDVVVTPVPDSSDRFLYYLHLTKELEDDREKNLNRQEALAIADKLADQLKRVLKDVSGKLEEAYIFTKSGLSKLMEAGAVSNLQMNYKTKSGEKIPVSFSGSVMKDKTGRLIGIVGVAKDMREIKRLMHQEKETAIAKAEANVERQKAKELKEAYKQLQELQDTLIQAEKLNAIGQLASGVAHEVKNPLGIIMQSVEYLEGKLLPSEKNAPEALQIIKNNIKRADNIIRVLLDFSRVSKLEKKPEDINSILENSLVLIQHRVVLENIKITRELGKGLPNILVDKSKLEQVFINIFLNALQVMPEGGNLFLRTYQAKLSKPKKGVGAREEDYFRLGENVLMVEIEDTGTGILPENLKKIFDPFFTTKDQGEGTGLGLSVTRNILIMHKGLIEIESQLGRGTKVIITLKISDGGKNG